MFDSNSSSSDEALPARIEAAANSGEAASQPPGERSAPPAESATETGQAERPSSAEPAPPTPATVSLDAPEIPFELDCRQRLALTSLVRGSSMKKASRDAGVARSTVYKWMNEHPGFRAAYNGWKTATQASAHSQVLALQDLAVEVLEEELATKRNAQLAARILEKTGALAPPTPGPTHPGRAAAEITAEQRELDAGIAKRARNAKDGVQWIPREFRFTDPPGQEAK